MTEREPTLPVTLSESRWGLCATCDWARLVPTKRGSEFLRCSRSESDARFPRYPSVPVRRCAGYANQEDPAQSDSGI